MIPVQIGNKIYEVEVTFKNLLLLEELLKTPIIEFMNYKTNYNYLFKDIDLDNSQLEFLKRNELI